MADMCVVFDGVRFRVTVRFTDDDETLPSSVKVLEGQSLVAITELAPSNEGGSSTA